MKKILLSSIYLILSICLFAQTPQVFQYQAVVRDASGTALVNQSVNFQLSIISGSVSGPVEYTETHSASTNAYGIVTLNVGGGNPVTGTFNSISWGTDLYFIKVEADPTGGTSYIDMGTTQLLSVPYALYAETSGNAGQVYTAGTGISISGNVITNDSPDQVVNLNSGTGVQVSGSYPNYTIDNSQPDQPVSLTGTGSTTVTGTYPNFTINSTDNNTVYSGGTGINVTGTTITNTSPDQTVNLTGTGSTTVSGAYPNFTINSTDNNTIYTGGTGINVAGTTITNTSPDQTVNLTGTGSTTVSGTYPNFTINSTDNNTTYTAGTGLSLTGTTFNSVWSTNGANIYKNNTGNVGIGTNTPANQLHIYNSTGASSAKIGSTSTSFDNRLFFGDGSFVYIGEENADDRLSIKAGTMSLNIVSGGGLGTAGQVLKSNGTTVSWQNESSTVYTGGTGINVTGTTITNTSPDQTVNLTGGGLTTVSGTYPNFTISSTGGTPGGQNKTVQFNNSGSFGGDTAMIWDNTNKRLGVGLTNPNGRMVIRGSALAPATEPLFEVKDATGHTVFVVYPDSVHIYVKDGGAKSNQGGFAVSGRNAAKAVTDNYLTVTPDSTRIFTGDTISGFGVENLGTGTSTSYLHLTPSNYFIGHQAGDAITTGLYNSFLGYQCGLNNTTGSFNVFQGYKSGYSNIVGNYNTFIGFVSGQSNTSSDNTFIGFETGKAHQTGGGNVYLGSKAGRNDIGGAQNVFIGESAGENNNIGSSNIFLGFSSGRSNSDGSSNVMIGNQSGYFNTIGTNNIFMGNQSGYSNTLGYRNNFIGQQAGRNNTTGNENEFIGYAAGRDNQTGSRNDFIGMYAGLFNTTGSNNAFIGGYAGWHNDTGDYNVFIGTNSGFSSYTSNRVVLVGNNANVAVDGIDNSTAIGYGTSVNQSNKVRIGNSAVTVIEGQVAYTFPSDGRFKTNITEDVKGLDFINKLRPVVYNFDTRKFDAFLMKNESDSLRDSKIMSTDYSKSTSIRQTGFIAQEVEQAAKESGFDFNGLHKPENDNDNYSVAYSLFVVPLVKAVQELNVKITDQQSVIDALQKENDFYKTKILEQDKKIEKINVLLGNEVR